MHTRGNKGISTIIATVLIVLITVAAVTILWAGVSPLIDQQIGQSYLSSLEVDRGGYTAYDSALNKISVRVTRGSDDVPMTGFKIVVTDENGNTYEETIDEVLAPNSAKVYRFNKGSIGTPTSVLVVPIFEVNGDSVEGTPTQKEVSFVDKAITEPVDYGDFGSGGGPTCNDRIQNGDETGVDCGGSSCSNTCHYLDILEFENYIVGYWKFDNSVNSNDFSGLYPTLSCTNNGGVGFVTGHDAQSVSFSGAGTDYITCPDVVSNTGTAMTVSIWVKPDVFPNPGVLYLISENNWRIGLNRNNGYAVSAFLDSTQGNTWISGGQTITPASGWYHVVLVWDGTADRYETYVNAVGPFTQNPESINQFDNSGTELKIGQWYNSYYMGDLDELIIFDRALTKTDVQNLYAATIN